MKKFVSFFMAALCCVSLPLLTACGSDNKDDPDSPDQPGQTTTLTSSEVEIEILLSDDILNNCDMEVTYTNNEGTKTVTNPQGEKCPVEVNGSTYPGKKFDFSSDGDSKGASVEVSIKFSLKNGANPTDKLNFVYGYLAEADVKYSDGSYKDLNASGNMFASTGLNPEKIETFVNALNRTFASLKATVNSDGTLSLQ